MSYGYSKYCLSNKGNNGDNSSSQRTTGNLSSEYNDSFYSVTSHVEPRPPSIYINPNSLLSSGSVHVNKSKFNVNSISSSRNPFPTSTPKLTENKIHYNPKFLGKPQKFLSSNAVPCQNSRAKIHINPSFAQNLNIDEHLMPTSSDFIGSRLSDCNNSDKHVVEPFKDNIHINPNFIGLIGCNEELTNISTVNSNFITVDTKLLPPGNDRSSQIFNSGFRELNKRSPTLNKHFSKISDYKIQRVATDKENRPVSIKNQLSIVAEGTLLIPVRKPRLSNSFKKIGKRKLVRKSLIQRYIISRRQSIPTMIQHSRNTIATKNKLNRSSFINKYKFVKSNTSPNKVNNVKKSNYKKIIIPSRSKLKWNRVNSVRIHDFVKIGKRKIVRKSVLQAILEARRSSLRNPVKYSPNKKYLASKEKSKPKHKTIETRYKLIRNISSRQSSHRSQLNSSKFSKYNSSFATSKKRDLGPVNCVLKSKSIFFRMPPNIRIKIRMEEKRKRMLLLKKVNNRKKCLYYNRFGHCKGLAEGTCKKLHDFKSVAVCRKFLKGLCNGEECKLSHQVVPEKMPICHQFLAGVCVRPLCPFLHVKLSEARPICIDFLQGFCHHGDNCMKRHQFICPEWAEKRSCSIDKCPYPHPSSNPNKKVLATTEPPIKQENATKPYVTDELKQPSNDIRNRYFTSETDGSKSKISHEDPNNQNDSDKKPELNDGINSVYDNESLLSFIPFS